MVLRVAGVAQKHLVVLALRLVGRNKKKKHMVVCTHTHITRAEENKGGGMQLGAKPGDEVACDYCCAAIHHIVRKNGRNDIHTIV